MKIQKYRIHKTYRYHFIFMAYVLHNVHVREGNKIEI